MKGKFVAVNPDGDLVFNTKTQSPFFPTKTAAIRGIREELEEPSSEDDENEYSLGEDEGWLVDDYRIFEEV